MGELAEPAVFVILGQKNSAFRAPGLLSCMPGVIDSLYKIEAPTAHSICKSDRLWKGFNPARPFQGRE